MIRRAVYRHTDWQTEQADRQIASIGLKGLYSLSVQHLDEDFKNSVSNNNKKDSFLDDADDEDDKARR